jgi:hypothetical protein
MDLKNAQIKQTEPQTPHLENPGAWRRLIQQIKDGASWVPQTFGNV